MNALESAIKKAFESACFYSVHGHFKPRIILAPPFILVSYKMIGPEGKTYFYGANESTSLFLLTTVLLCLQTSHVG